MSAVAKQALYLALLVTLTACNDAKAPVETPVKVEAAPSVAPKAVATVEVEAAQVLPYLAAQPAPAQFVLPKCSAQHCLAININSLSTGDAWFNAWLSARQAEVLMLQLQQDPANLSLQQAVNRYAAASKEWQQQYHQHQAFRLDLDTAVVYQKNGIVLLQIQVNSHQAETKVLDRLYFFVADRNKQQHLPVKQVIAPDYAKTLQDILNQHYKKWLSTQSDQVKTAAPTQLAWQQGQWFYDQEGIGLHFRAGQISPTAEQLDVYLNAAQSKRVLKAQLYQILFHSKSTPEEPNESKNRAA